jgi:hypothetical protein
MLTFHGLETVLQIPSFKPRHAAPAVTLKAVKTNHQVEFVTEIVVIASNTAVLGGIQDAWLENGLRLPLSLRCGQPDACNVPNDCSIVWLETQNCMVLNESHFTLRPLELQAALAFLELGVRPLSLREGSYAYRIHLPVPNDLTFPTTVLEGTLEVVAVPSPELSDVWICSGVQQCDAATALEPNIKHLPEAFVYIAVKDIDGYSIDRPNILLSILHVAEPLSRNTTFSAVFESSTSRYVVALGNFETPGEHRIFIATDASESSASQFEKARFSVVCSDGYIIDKGTSRCVVGEFNTTWLFVGACATALVVMSGLFFLVRRRRLQLQAIIMMLLTEVGQLVLSLCMALGNLATDGIVCDSLLRGELKVASGMYTAAYVVILCFGVVATTFSICYRLRNAWLVRAQLQLLLPQGQAVAAATSEARRQAQQNEWELLQTHRTKVTLSLSLMSVVVQGAQDSVGERRDADRSWYALQIFRCPS